MNRECLNRLTRVVMYEGYMLYPYRPSVKNAQRFTFGTVYPKRWNAAEPTDAAVMQSEVLVQGAEKAEVEIGVRFLQLQNRTEAENECGMRNAECGKGTTGPAAWQESVEREIALPKMMLRDLVTSPQVRDFSFGHERKTEAFHASDSTLVVREQEAIAGRITVSAVSLAAELVRVTVEVVNTTASGALAGRDAALLRSFISTHILLGVEGAEFVSLTDPPAALKEQARACRNVGVWPILVGTSPEKSTMLASPIILPDYPEIAPESPGDLFDATEIDEILTLRILTLTEEEKKAAVRTDERVKKMLERTENLAREQMASLHGAMRDADMKPFTPDLAGAPSQAEDGMVNWTPYDAELDEQTHIKEVRLPGGQVLRPGDQVILHPSKKADIFDIALAGKRATVMRIEQDFEDRVHVAVTVDDDPGRDLGREGKIGHRFFFGLEEVEAVAVAVEGEA